MVINVSSKWSCYLLSSLAVGFLATAAFAENRPVSQPLPYKPSIFKPRPPVPTPRPPALPPWMKEMTAGRLLVQQGRLREALWSYWRASLRNNREAAPFYQMAQVYAQLSEFDKAIYNYDQAIARSRNFANAYHGRGLACLRQGDAVKALADIDTAIKMNRESNASGVSYSQSSASTRSSRDEDYSKSRARAVMALVSAHMIPAWQ